MFKPNIIGLVSLPERPDLLESIEQMQRLLDRHQIEHLVIRDRSWFDDEKNVVDLLMTFGGDGTILSMASIAARRGFPLAGINVGRLGFLTVCSLNELEFFVEMLSLGKCLLEKRAMLQVQRINSQGQCIGERKLALNEVTLMRSETGKMIDLDAIVDDVLLNRYHADGIVIATPTGSSAYSLSAGGPLIWPSADVICVTPVCPHSLTNRAVVLPARAIIELRPRARKGREDEMKYSVDGREPNSVEIGDSLLISQSAEQMTLLHLPNYHFADLLRAKLRWQGSELP